MATIVERQGKRGRVYKAVVRISPHPTISRSFRRRTDAVDWARKTEQGFKDRAAFPEREAGRHTIADLVARRKKEIDGDTSKQRSGTATCLDWFGAEIGHLLLSEVSPSRLAECRDKLARQKSGPTANRYLAALSRAFTLAVKEWGWMRDNPLRNVSRKSENQGRVRFLSDAERKALLRACQASTVPALYPVVVLALSTGMRRGEILGLTWDRVDMKRGWITLENTKNGDRRGLPLASHAEDVMKDWAKVRHIDDPRVFPVPSSTLRHTWDRAVKAAEVPDFRFHDLRHTAASALLMSGASLREIADVLGHRTMQMVMRYSHVADDHRAKVVERMNVAMFGEQTHESQA